MSNEEFLDYNKKEQEKKNLFTSDSLSTPEKRDNI